MKKLRSKWTRAQARTWMLSNLHNYPEAHRCLSSAMFGDKLSKAEMIVARMLIGGERIGEQPTWTNLIPKRQIAKAAGLTWRQVDRACVKLQEHAIATGYNGRLFVFHNTGIAYQPTLLDATMIREYSEKQSVAQYKANMDNIASAERRSPAKPVAPVVPINEKTAVQTVTDWIRAALGVK
jgi:hypothetical protein